MKNFFFCIGFIAMLNSTTYSQEYKNGIGLRLGGLTSGLSFKHFISDKHAFEMVLSVPRRGVVFTGLYQVHQSLGNQGLYWCYGGGAHIGSFGRNGGYFYVQNKNKIYYFEGNENTFVLGLDLNLGLEYKIPNAPLSLGVDLKPIIDFYDGAYGFFDGGFLFRFTF